MHDLKLLSHLTLLTVILNCQSASADNWRDDNPNQPNGYAASMYRYHHGTPDDDGPHDGYRATEARSRYGLDRFAPPSKNDGWGDSGDSDGGGGGRWGGGGSGLGRHFRQGQAEGEHYWNQRLQSRMGGAGMGMQSSGFGRMNSGMPAGYANGVAGGASGNGWGQQMQARQQMQMRQAIPMPQGYSNSGASAINGGYPMNSQMPHFDVNNQMVAASGNYQYAPSNGGYNNGSINSTALRHALGQRPIGTLLRNSQGGFNHIYSGQ
jgi:hypothetical protein